MEHGEFRFRHEKPSYFAQNTLDKPVLEPFFAYHKSSTVIHSHETLKSPMPTDSAFIEKLVNRLRILTPSRPEISTGWDADRRSDPTPIYTGCPIPPVRHSRACASAASAFACEAPRSKPKTSVNSNEAAQARTRRTTKATACPSARTRTKAGSARPSRSAPGQRLAKQSLTQCGERAKACREKTGQLAQPIFAGWPPSAPCAGT